MDTFWNGEEYRLRNLFLAYEDRRHILTPFVETFTRLACAANEYYTEHVTPSMFWAKVDVLMTDDTTKNLGLEDTIPNVLVHFIIHFICFAKAIPLISQTTSSFQH